VGRATCTGLILGMLGLSFLSPALSAVADSLEINGRGITGRSLTYVLFCQPQLALSLAMASAPSPCSPLPRSSHRRQRSMNVFRNLWALVMGKSNPVDPSPVTVLIVGAGMRP